MRVLAVVVATGALSSTVAACSSDDTAGSDRVTNSTLATDTLTPATTITPATVAPVTTAAPTTAPATTAAPAPTTTRPATTTTAATTTTEPPTTTTAPPGASLSLRSDGIADARFGTEPDDVIAYVSGVIGEPTEDSGWVDAISRTCAGTEVRILRWADLILLFGDESAVSSGRRHFFAWSFGPAEDVRPSPAGLATPEGISVGSSVADIGRAYPATTLFEGDELATASAHINDDLFAFITGTRDSSVITAMVGGHGCGE